MSKLRCCEILIIAGFMGICLAGGASGQEIDSIIQYKKHFVKANKQKTYGLVSASEGREVPVSGFGLIIVIPDGKDIGNCESFIKKLSVSTKYLVAQLMPVQLEMKDAFIWPTKKHRINELKFSTEEFVDDVVREVKSRYKVNPEQVFTLSWGSGGLAGYAVSLQKSKSVTGSYIAASPFDPKQLPLLENAKGHGYVVDYSPSSKICPENIARSAAKILKANGAKVKVLPNKKNSDWKTESFSRIRYGIRWLERNHGKGIVEVDKNITAVAKINTEDGKSVDEQKHFDPNSVIPGLLVEPLVGVGGMKLGISKEDVIKRFGKPALRQNAGGSSVRLNYDDIGFVINVHPQKGVTRINCFGDMGGKQFAFITQEGVEIGATKTEIEDVYGKARRTQKLSADLSLLDYPNLGASFLVRNGKLCQIQLFAGKL